MSTKTTDSHSVPVEGPKANRSRLPRGRHGLSRAEVEADQRFRIAMAMSVAMSEKGYGATTVADILAGAGVSRESFYALFDSKSDCFLKAFEMAAAELLRRVQAGGAAELDGSPRERLALVVSAYLDQVRDNPAQARLFLVESWAAGPAALQRRIGVQEVLAENLMELLGLDGQEASFNASAFVACVGSLVSRELLKGEDADLDQLRRPVVDVGCRMLEL